MKRRDLLLDLALLAWVCATVVMYGRQVLPSAASAVARLLGQGH